MEEDRTLIEVQKSIAKLETQVSGALKRIEESSKRENVLNDIARKLDVLQESVDGKLLTLQTMMEGKFSHFDAEIGRLCDRVDKHGKEIDELQQKPGKRWDGLVGNIISLVAGAIVTFIAVQLGLK